MSSSRSLAPMGFRGRPAGILTPVKLSLPSLPASLEASSQKTR